MSVAVALVTGAGSGIGKAAALKLASDGFAIGALGRTADEIASTVAEIDAAGGEGVSLLADIADERQMADAVGQLVKRFGRLDVVVANAGINGVWAPIEELRPEEWSKTLDINLKGTFLTVKYAAPHLKKQGGSVIITSSVNGTRVFSGTGATAYSSSKAGQVALAIAFLGVLNERDVEAEADDREDDDA